MPERAAGSRLGERLVAEGVVVAALAGWWAMAQALPSFVLPGPLEVGAALWKLFTEPAFLRHTAASAQRVVLAVACAVALGGLLAWLPHRFALLDHVVHRRIQPLLNSFPSVGWALLAVIWFRVSDFSVVFVEVMILIPFCLINIAAGLRELDAELLEMGRSFTRSRGRLFFRLVLPLLAPYLMAAVKIAYGIGWKIALVAELFGARSGLGFLMLQAQVNADAVTVLATCLAIVLIFFAGERLVIDPIAAATQRRTA